MAPTGWRWSRATSRAKCAWPELLDIRLSAQSRGFDFGNQSAMIPGIQLRVKGASILIADIYDRPLCVIYNRILAASGRATPVDFE